MERANLSLANLEPRASGASDSPDQHAGIRRGCTARACSDPMTSRVPRRTGTKEMLFKPALTWKPAQPKIDERRCARFGRQVLAEREHSG